MNKSVHKIGKMFTSNCFLYMIMIVPQLKKFSTLFKASHHSHHIIDTILMHTQNFTYGFILGPLQLQSIGYNMHFPSKQQFDHVGFQEKIQFTVTKTNKPEPNFRKLNSHYFFLLIFRPWSYFHTPTPCHYP